MKRLQETSVLPLLSICLLLVGLPAGCAAGQSYEATVPDTLDLADRAGLAINGLTGSLDVKADYEIYFRVHYTRNPAVMYHEGTGLPTNNPKFAEALPQMRIMSGSDLNQDIEKGMMDYMVSCIGKDGLYYAKIEGKPWLGERGGLTNPADEDFANVYGNSRMMLAMMA